MRKLEWQQAIQASADPQRAKQLMAEAGYPNGFDAGPISVDISWATVTEAIVNYLRAAGIRATVLLVVILIYAGRGCLEPRSGR